MSLPCLALLAALAISPILPALRAQEVVPASALASGGTHGFLKAGDVAPEFSVVGPQGETIKLSDYRGKIIVVDISATWCGPCQAAMPNNERVFKKYADQGVVLLGVTADDSREAYDGWIKRSVGKYTFTMTFDLPGKDGWKDSIFNTGYRVTGFPTMFVIGRDGKILETVSGGGPGEDYRLEYALARAGVKVDLAAIPAEPKKDPAGPKSIPMIAKTAAMPAAGGMVGMGSPVKREPIPGRFGSVNARDAVPDFTVTGAHGAPVKLSSFAGKPVLVHFVSGGTGPQPWFSKILSDYKDGNFSTLVVFSATERADFDKWVAANPNPGFTVAWDPAGKAWAEGVTNTTFGVGMFPASLVATAEGKLVSGTIGMGDKVATMLKMMLTTAKAITPTEADLATMRTYVQSVIGAGGGMPAATKPAAAPVTALLGVGAIAPDFTMRDINDQEVKLSDYKGKIVILDFWATWCGPCIASFPHTQEVAAKYKDQDVVVLASGTSDTIEAFKKWIPANQPKYPAVRFVFDPNERGGATFEERSSKKLYHVSGIPTQFIIGRDGKIAATLVGYGSPFYQGDLRSEVALSKLGVKVDAATVAEGEKQLARDAAEEIKNAAAAKDAEKNPVPGFRESYGKLKAGSPVSDFTALRPDGTEVKFSELSKGKTVVLTFWTAGNGVPDAALAFSDAWAKKYADQGVLFVGVGAYGTREEFARWYQANRAKFSFPVLFDPAGRIASAGKPNDQMTPEEKKANQDATRAHYAKVIPMALTGGAMAPVPNNLIIDPQGDFLGFYVGAGPQSAESLGNLLLRSGVKLAAEDMPKKVFTAGETKEAAPEAKIEMLKIGAAAPDFATTDLNGKTVRISDFKGKVVILDFWAPWCGPCIASMPHTQQVATTYKDQGVVVLGSCTSDTRANFDKWVKTNQEKYPDFIFAHDAAERTPDRASRKLYGVTGIPTQFIIDREGKIAAISIGYLPGEVLLDAALAKAGVKVDAALLAKAAEDRKQRDNR